MAETIPPHVEIIRRVDNINPLMKSQDVISALHDYRVMRSEMDRRDKLVYEARNAMLIKYGEDPNEWEYYKDFVRRYSEFNEDEQKRALGSLPKRIRSLILPGSVSWVDDMVGVSDLFPQQEPFIMVWQGSCTIFVQVEKDQIA